MPSRPHCYPPVDCRPQSGAISGAISKFARNGAPWLADMARVLDLLYPPICVACTRLLRRPSALPLCTTCAPDAVPLPKPALPAATTALFAYEGALARAVTRLKFGGQPALAGPLGRLLAAGLGPAPDRKSVV